MKDKMSNRPFSLDGRWWIMVLALPAIAGCSADAGGDPSPSRPDDGAETPVNYAASDACTVVPQEGCPADHTCLVVTVDGATTCQSAGSAPLGGLCSGNSDCAPGLVCVESTCRSFCGEPSDCGGVASACNQVSHGSEPVKGWSICSIACNPADPPNAAGANGLVACPAGMACFSLDPSDGPKGSTSCFPAGAAQEGAACMTGGDCAAGLVCLNDGGSSSCRPMCLVGQSQCTCLSFAVPLYAASAFTILEVGFCQ